MQALKRLGALGMRLYHRHDYLRFFTFTVVTVGFNPTEYNISEGDGVVMPIIERRGATAQPVMVTVTTNNITTTGI